MRRTAVIALVVVMVAAATAGAQVSVGAGYLAGFYPVTYPTTSLGISSDFIVGADAFFGSAHVGAEVVLWPGAPLGLEGTLDLMVVRSPASPGGFAYWVGIGLEPWVSFSSYGTFFSADVHVPFEVTWQPKGLPVQAFVKLAPYFGLTISPLAGNMFYGVDASIGARWVLFSPK